MIRFRLTSMIRFRVINMINNRIIEMIVGFKIRIRIINCIRFRVINIKVLSPDMCVGKIFEALVTFPDQASFIKMLSHVVPHLLIIKQT